jgi:hypothetical protein
VGVVDKLLATPGYVLDQKEAKVIDAILNHFETPSNQLKEILNKGPDGGVVFPPGVRAEVIDLCDSDDIKIGDIDRVKIKLETQQLNALEGQFASMKIKVRFYFCLFSVHYLCSSQG